MSKAKWIKEVELSKRTIEDLQEVVNNALEVMESVTEFAALASLTININLDPSATPRAAVKITATQLGLVELRGTSTQDLEIQ